MADSSGEVRSLQNYRGLFIAEHDYHKARNVSLVPQKEPQETEEYKKLKEKNKELEERNKELLSKAMSVHKHSENMNDPLRLSTVLQMYEMLRLHDWEKFRTASHLTYKTGSSIIKKLFEACEKDIEQRTADIFEVLDVRSLSDAMTNNKQEMMPEIRNLFRYSYYKNDTEFYSKIIMGDLSHYVELLASSPTVAGLTLCGTPNSNGITAFPCIYSRLNTRPVFGGVRSRIGVQQNILNRSSPAVSFQRTFDARQKIGLTDARHKLGVKDAREKLVQKDARFKIKGKVQDAREMLNSRKQQSVAAEKVTKVVDAREKISLKRSAPATISPAMGTVNPAVKITKTIQGLYDMEDDDESVSPLTSKQMKITTTNSFLHNAAGLSGNKFSLSKTVPLTKVVQNDTYTAPPAPPSPMRTKALTNMSRTLVTKEEPPKEPAPVELAFSPLEGTKMTVNNLHPRVTEEDIVELFCVCGALKRARLVHPGVAEVVFVKKEDAITAYKKYNNRCLDGQPMKCNLHMNGNVITSDQPILLRLSDTPSVKKEGEPRRSSASASSNPPAEVDPDTILKALFKSSGVSASVQPTEFKIKL
ncbi:PREDICTED: polymerase delta-interacting protein 3 [Charadrius vociferus]|uniref:polymerase delta-interacting protein 3 n=1 Tax=Charadrius vociferus TaxID=50402 RepID=UPI0005218A3C|nr:PREDICTED: polymerase delta-interacting protein 3 [Charadrius vociferus]